MQQADITAITRELAGLIAERYVFPSLGADLSRLLEGGLADGRYTLAPDEESLATTLTQDLQSRGGDQHLRLLHSPTELHERGDEAAELAALADWAERTAGGSPGPSGSTATSATSTCSRCCSPRRSRGRPWPPR